MIMIKKCSLISEATAGGEVLEEGGSLAESYAIENYFEDGRDHAHSLDYKRANYVNDDFVASSAATLFEGDSADASSQHELRNVAKFEKDEHDKDLYDKY